MRSVSLHRTPSNPQRLVGSPANPRRPVNADSGEVTHARCPKPGSAMHRLWFSHEAGGDRAEHAGPGLANVFLPTMQAGPAPRHRQRRDRSVGSAKTVRPSSSNPGAPLAALPNARARETPLAGGFPSKMPQIAQWRIGFSAIHRLRFFLRWIRDARTRTRYTGSAHTRLQWLRRADEAFGRPSQLWSASCRTDICLRWLP